MAYRKAGDDVKATLQFNKVIDESPASAYGHAAEQVLRKMRQGDSSDDGA